MTDRVGAAFDQIRAALALPHAFTTRGTTSYLTLMGALDALRVLEREHEQLQAEAERLRDALMRCYQVGKGRHVEIARAALDAMEVPADE